MNYYLFWGFLAVNYSPGDAIYRMLETPRHPLRVAVVFGEAVDAITTPFGAFEKGMRLHPNAPWAGYVAALAAVLGGSIFRYFERRGRGRGASEIAPKEQMTEWGHPSGSIQAGAVYIVAYATLRKLGVGFARLYLTLFHCCVKVARVGGGWGQGWAGGLGWAGWGWG